jgi:nitrate/nitrite transport system permease protein
MAIKEKLLKGLDIAGLKVFEPVVKLACGEEPKEQVRQIVIYIGIPLLAFFLFLLMWTGIAKTIETKFGTLPTPVQVAAEAGNLVDDHFANRAEEQAFYEQQELKAAAIDAKLAELNGALATAGAAQKPKLEKQVALLTKRADKTRTQKYSSSPTYWDQILTSLLTVFAGFLVASIIAIPIGVLCGLSKVFLAAVNPLIQIFKPVSPLAWLPIVMIVVGALYTTDPREAWFEKSFISSALTVALCSLWPTLVNTGLGVASIDKDHMNVAKVLNLGFWTRVRKIVLPAALPLMFAGLRISLGVGWMVLIAAEMLAQNPGLGKFVWDMFQNGSSQTLAQIIVAVFTIGGIGFILDRVMIILQRSVSYDSTVSA